jgi:wyosine [tRNA(Phe)-imidazoG37] synthetase (radical SAM superfamily)
MSECNLVFGPVISRRLGISLGINNIPYKICSYSCIYCQLGKTLKISIERKPYSIPEKVLQAVSKVLETRKDVDYATFVPDGEPTLDTNLGRDIKLLKKELDVRIAVLTNASLLWIDDVRKDLGYTNAVSVKVDAASKPIWKLVNRPHPKLEFTEVIEGIKTFSREYTGKLLTETMLIDGINDKPSELVKIAELIESLSPAKAYIAIPTRPPAEKWVKGAKHEALAILYEELRSKGVEAELLVSDEPIPPEAEDPVQFIMATTLVHPLRLDYATELIRRKGRDPNNILPEILSNPEIKIVEYRGYKFIVRRPIVKKQ